MSDRHLGAEHGARSWLRAATAEVHEALHHLPAFEALLAGQLGREGYGRLLRGLHAYHGGAAAICAAADRTLGIAPAGGSSGIRVARLEDDLAELGLTPLPAAPRAPSADSAWNVGFAYVVSGSAIGGQLLFRALDALFAHGAGGRSFFALEAEERAAWRRFCALVDDMVPGKAFSRAARGAHAGFATFRTAIDGAMVVLA